MSNEGVGIVKVWASQVDTQYGRRVVDGLGVYRAAGAKR